VCGSGESTDCSSSYNGRKNNGTLAVFFARCRTDPALCGDCHYCCTGENAPAAAPAPALAAAPTAAPTAAPAPAPMYAAMKAAATRLEQYTVSDVGDLPPVDGTGFCFRRDSTALAAAAAPPAFAASTTVLDSPLHAQLTMETMPSLLKLGSVLFPAAFQQSGVVESTILSMCTVTASIQAATRWWCGGDVDCSGCGWLLQAVGWAVSVLIFISADLCVGPVFILLQLMAGHSTVTIALIGTVACGIAGLHALQEKPV